MPEETNSKRPRPVVEVVEEPKTVSETQSVAPPSEPEAQPVVEPQPTIEPAHDPEPQSSQPAVAQPQKTNFKLIFAVSVVTALIIGFVAGGVYVYFTGVKGTKKDTTADTTLSSPAPLPTNTASTTPTAKPVNIAEYGISILNGSGTVGEATRANDLVEGDGFTVINTGNAKTFDFTDTVIQATSIVPETVIERLEESLSKQYSVVIGDPLPDSSEYDIVVTLGAK